MFSLAYVILPFADIVPADAIRASLARFQRGGRGEVPDGWLTFHDETQALRRESSRPSERAACAARREALLCEARAALRV